MAERDEGLTFNDWWEQNKQEVFDESLTQCIHKVYKFTEKAWMAGEMKNKGVGMPPDPRAERVRVLKMVAEDMKSDAKSFDGKPFNGRTVAEYFGNQGAAIAALARILRETIEEGM